MGWDMRRNCAVVKVARRAVKPFVCEAYAQSDQPVFDQILIHPMRLTLYVALAHIFREVSWHFLSLECRSCANDETFLRVEVQARDYICHDLSGEPPAIHQPHTITFLNRMIDPHPRLFHTPLQAERGVRSLRAGKNEA